MKRFRMHPEIQSPCLPFSLSPPAMLPGTLIICSAIGYALALALELLGLRQRFAWRPIALRVLTLYALLAHTVYLVKNATSNGALPISTADWLLWAAWLIAIIYFAALFYLP